MYPKNKGDLFDANVRFRTQNLFEADVRVRNQNLFDAKNLV